MSFFTRILLRFGLTCLLFWAFTTYLPQFILITGGWKGLLTVSAIVTVMNLIVSPLLNLAVLPLRLIATILAILLANAVFLWLTIRAVEYLVPTIATLRILGGIPGWIVIALSLGLAKWLMKMILK